MLASLLLILAQEKAFVVVAPEKFHASLVDFVAHKKKQLSTELASLEKILKETKGVDDPEKLKRWLYAEWKEKKVGYALLVGDADVMPVRYMVLDRVTPAAFDYAFYPCDLYYGDLAKSDGSFDDWNARHDDFHAGYFGEVRGEKNKGDPINFDAIDYRPDIAVGRWPVSTADEVKIVAAKTIAYENGTLRRKAALVCVEGWVDTRPRLDEHAASLKGWNVEKRYYADKDQKDATPPPTEDALVKLLNDGVGLVCHTGHGSNDSWAGCFSTGSIDKLKNADRLPIMISIGCSTACFASLGPYEAYVDVNGKEHAGTNNKEEFKEPPPPPAPYQPGAHNTTGLGEALVRHASTGAVAYIGCNTGSQPCGFTLLEGFLDALSESKSPRLGDLWAKAVASYYDREKLADLKPNDDWYPPSIFFQGMKFMLFGDPTLKLPAPK